VDYRTLDVTYIKLAINNDLFLGCKRRDKCPSDDCPHVDCADAEKFYGKPLVDYYLRSRENKCGNWLFKCKFPQYSTKDQSYSSDQFMAYIDLGYSVVLNSENLDRVDPALQTRKTPFGKKTDAPKGFCKRSDNSADIN
jgi:hypothetical protein